MTCLDERRLFEVHFGDPADDDRAHVAACSDCAARLQVLRRDLARVDTVLRTTPPRMRARRVDWRWAPIAVAAVLAFAVAIPRQRALAPDDDTLTLADELATTMTADAWLETDDVERPPMARSMMTRSTCTWGDPLLEVGCDEPDVMRVAWR